MASFASRREAFAALKSELNGAAGVVPRVALEQVIPLELPSLDRLLGGGFPVGMLVALEGSAGRWSIVARLAAQVTCRGLAAIVDDGGLYPPALARAGARLDRIMVVPGRTPLGAARAADILVRSRACRLVVMTAPELRPAVWARLASLAHRSGVALAAIASPYADSALAGAAGLRLRCSRERAIVYGTRGLACAIAGYDVRAELCKFRSSLTGAVASVRAGETLRELPQRERLIVRRERLAHAALR